MTVSDIVNLSGHHENAWWQPWKCSIYVLFIEEIDNPNYHRSGSTVFMPMPMSNHSRDVSASLFLQRAGLLQWVTPQNSPLALAETFIEVIFGLRLFLHKSLLSSSSTFTGVINAFWSENSSLLLLLAPPILHRYSSNKNLACLILSWQMFFEEPKLTHHSNIQTLLSLRKVSKDPFSSCIQLKTHWSTWCTVFIVKSVYGFTK